MFSRAFDLFLHLYNPLLGMIIIFAIFVVFLIKYIKKIPKSTEIIEVDNQKLES